MDILRDGAGFIALGFWSGVLGLLTLSFLSRIRKLNRMMKARNGMVAYGELGHGPIVGGDRKVCIYKDITTDGREVAEEWKDIRFGKSVIPEKFSEWYDIQSGHPSAGEYVFLHSAEDSVSGNGCVLIGLEVLDTDACRDYLQEFTHWLPGIKPPASI